MHHFNGTQLGCGGVVDTRARLAECSEITMMHGIQSTIKDPRVAVVQKAVNLLHIVFYPVTHEHLMNNGDII